jgi:hypothetical protein
MTLTLSLILNGLLVAVLGYALYVIHSYDKELKFMVELTKLLTGDKRT